MLLARRVQTNIGRRFLNLHEYISHDILRKYGVATVRGFPATSVDEAKDAAAKLGGSDFVVKAQILAGGRGKGTFLGGKGNLMGGVHMATSIDEVADLADGMLGKRLCTKQTGPEGKPVDTVYVVERQFLRREAYFAILLDRAAAGPVMVASSKGGMDIEQVAHDTPNLIFKENIDVNNGPTEEQLERLSTGMGFTGKAATGAVEVMRGLYTAFVESDATLIEINPLGEVLDGTVQCLDAKLNFDDNAEYRQTEIFSAEDKAQEEPREVEAGKHGLNYIQLDGSIGCLVNGAGLAMATMDIIKLKGGNPANFLDLGGGANETQVTKAFELLDSDPQVKAILVNIFGGIMRCDVIALGIIGAVTQLGLKKPLVIRLEGIIPCTYQC